MKKITISVLLMLFFVLCLKNVLIFKLNGKKNISISVNTNYIDDWYQAKFFNINLDSFVSVNDNLNITKIGKYQIIYTLNFLFFKKTLIRNIDVIDDIKPKILLNGDDLVIKRNDSYYELGFKAIDNYDFDITDKVVVNSNLNVNKNGIYYITYTVKDSSNNKTTLSRKVIVTDISNNKLNYINNILLVNKKNPLPKDYNPGINKIAIYYLHQLQMDAKVIGLDLPIISAFRSYKTQEVLFNNYYLKDGVLADTYSARPGYSEHQTGLAFDVGLINDEFKNTLSGKWLYNNCANYGFIIRYLLGKESITGYKYEPWHIRYIGNNAIFIMNNNLVLEEYLDT